MINSLFQPLFVASDTVWAVILYTLLVRLLWFFGIHGGSVSSAVVTPFITNNMLLNINAYAEGKPLPCIFTIEFQHIWTVMGILTLCITLLIFAKSTQLKTIAKVGLVPAFFTIGEPITFGVPTVLNFKLFIPYMAVFLLNGIIPFYLTKWEFLARTFVQLPDITPGIIGSFLNTLDWRAPIIFIGLTVLNIVIWAPFVKSYDNDLLKIEQGK